MSMITIRVVDFQKKNVLGKAQEDGIPEVRVTIEQECILCTI